MSKQEKRRYFRIHFKRQVQLDFFTDFYDECSVKNISLGGMYVNGTFPHKADDQCSVIVSQTSKTTSLTFKARAQIIRREDDGIALQFISMPFESLVSLELILLYEPEETSSDTEVSLPTDLPFMVCEEDPQLPDK